MAHAYTPGLKVSDNELLRKRRQLPLKGEVLVANGTKVSPDDIVARTFLPGKVDIVNVANKLGIDQTDVPASMLKKEGDEVEEGEKLAAAKSFFGLFKSDTTAPCSGTIESISGITGQVIIRGAPRPVEVLAYLDGKIVEVIEDEGVVVEAQGAFIQGIFGVGGETTGEIAIGTANRSEPLEPHHIKPEHKDKILVGGSLVTAAALDKAREVGVRAVVVGGFDDQDLRELLGYDLGVAITGHEKLGITLIVTEGFGELAMAPRTFELLEKHAGKKASVNGATQIRAGVIRPEVIIPLSEAGEVAAVKKAITGLTIGSPIRVIRAPYFGMLATVASLPPEPAVLDSGSKARVVEVNLENGTTATVPRTNVELIG